MAKFVLSAFADEYSPEIDKQIEGLKANGIDYEQIDSTMIQRIGDLEQDSVNWTVWWSVYVNGEYAQTGVDSTDVTAGAEYAFKAEK